MANFIGINKGQNEYQAVAATSTNSTDVEIQVNTTNVTTREDLLLALKNLEQFIMRSTYPLV